MRHHDTHGTPWVAWLPTLTSVATLALTLTRTRYVSFYDLDSAGESVEAIQVHPIACDG